MKILRRTGVVVLILVATLSTTTAPAMAWFGATHVTSNTATRYGGWVDGNGPDSYQAYAHCIGGGLAVGDERWAGDRGGSFATCGNGIKSGEGSRGFFLHDN
jgi:hypothetical protein